MGKSELSQELQEAIRRKDWRGAVNTLGQLARLEPRYAPHRLKMGDYYTKLRENGKAIASYQKAAEIFGEDGFIVKALAAYKIILRIDPRNPMARSGMEGLHGGAREQAPGLSLSRPGNSPGSFRGDTEKSQGPIMDAWEISKSHLLKDIEKSAGKAPGPDGPQDAPQDEKAAPPPGSPPRSSSEDEDLDEALIGSTPPDPDPPEKTKGESNKDFMKESREESRGPDNEGGEGLSSVSTGAFDYGSFSGGGAGSPAEASPVKPLMPSGGAGSNVLTLFSSLTKEEFAEVTDRMIPYLFDPGSKIVSEGDTGDSVFVVSSGTVQVSTRVGNKDVLLAELKDDDFFGEVSFLTGRPRTANIVASTATEILELPGDELRAVIGKFPRVHTVLEEFHRARALDTVEKIMPPGTEGAGDAD